MFRFILIALLVLVVAPAFASDRHAGRLNAITSGRLYDRILTPQLNPGFALDSRAEQELLKDVRAGRFNLDQVPPAQRYHFELQLDIGQ